MGHDVHRKVTIGQSLGRRTSLVPSVIAMRTPMRWMAVSGLVLALAACSATSGDQASSADMAYDEGQSTESGGFAGEEAEAPAAEPADGGGTDTNGAPFGEGLNLDDGNRSVITRGAVTVSTEDPVTAADDITRMVESMGGWVEGMTLQAGSDTIDPSAHVITRLPSSDVGTALGRLRDIGEVESVQLDRTDVTLEVRDLEARIRAVEMSVERMQALLARAASVEELVQAEQMLTDRQSQLEQLLSQQASLDDQVSMSTLTIDVVVPEDVPEVEEPEEPKEGFLGGLENGWNAFLDFGSGALLVLGVLLPWLAFAAVLALIVVWVRRVWVRTRPERPARVPGVSLPPTPAPGTWPGAPAGWAQPGSPVPPAAPQAAPVAPVPPAASAVAPTTATATVAPDAPVAPVPDEPKDQPSA